MGRTLSKTISKKTILLFSLATAITLPLCGCSYDPGPDINLTYADGDADTDRLLDAFDRDSRTFMDRDPSGEPIDDKELIDQEALDAKNEARDEIIEAAGPRAESAAKEKIEDLVDKEDLMETDGRILRNLREIDARGYKSVDLTNEVWSSSIYNEYRGHTAQRYASRSSSKASSWQKAWALVSKPGHSFYDIVTSGDADKIDKLSPAEKYDLLLGSIEDKRDGWLTNYEWGSGRSRMEQEGVVPKWHGYCHGWAPASISVPRPLRAIDVPAADGQSKIRFYPEDIKALSVALWANALPRIRLIGGRCDEKDPQRDSTGRVISEKCQDGNPGIFHMALVNQMGVAKKNLLIDSTYDRQVWNQPLVSYKYRYFNPQTKKSTSRLERAAIAREKFTKDKFEIYRSPDAVEIVGVSLEIEYKRITVPKQRQKDSAEYDGTKKVKYLYDLELNRDGEIIGGEWYQVRHPDFIWVPARGETPKTAYEAQAKGPWNLSDPLPESWRESGVKASAQGQPLARIVNALVAASRNETPAESR